MLRDDSCFTIGGNAFQVADSRKALCFLNRPRSAIQALTTAPSQSRPAPSAHCPSFVANWLVVCHPDPNSGNSLFNRSHAETAA